MNPTRAYVLFWLNVALLPVELLFAWAAALDGDWFASLLNLFVAFFGIFACIHLSVTFHRARRRSQT